MESSGRAYKAVWATFNMAGISKLSPQDVVRLLSPPQRRNSSLLASLRLLDDAITTFSYDCPPNNVN